MIEEKYNKWKKYRNAVKFLQGFEGVFEQFQKDGSIRLNSRKLEKIPKELKYISGINGHPNIKTINLSGNRIENIPEWLAELEHLEIISFRENRIKKIPTETLKKFKSLKEVNLINNPICKENIENKIQDTGVIITCM